MSFSVYIIFFVQTNKVENVSNPKTMGQEISSVKNQESS